MFVAREKFPHVVVLISSALSGQHIASVVERESDRFAAASRFEFRALRPEVVLRVVFPCGAHSRTAAFAAGQESVPEHGECDTERTCNRSVLVVEIIIIAYVGDLPLFSPCVRRSVVCPKIVDVGRIVVASDHIGRIVDDEC